MLIKCGYLGFFLTVIGAKSIFYTKNKKAHRFGYLSKAACHPDRRHTVYTRHTSRCRYVGCTHYSAHPWTSPLTRPPHAAFKFVPDKFVTRITYLSKLIGINESHPEIHPTDQRKRCSKRKRFVLQLELFRV